MNLRVSAALWQNGIPIVTADAANSGFGTVLARGTALQNLVNSAAAEFASQLRKLAPSLRVVPDAPVSSSHAPGTRDEGAGEITIEASVTNADVHIDGKFVGNAPLQAYKLAPGDHSIEVSAPGYASWQKTLTVTSGSPARVIATLTQSVKP